MDENPLTASNILQKSVHAAKYTFLFKVLSQVTAAIVIVFLVRGLTEQDYGVYNLLYSIISLIAIIASFGIANTLQRFIPEYYAKGEFKIAHNLYIISALLRLFSNIFILGIALILWDQLSPYVKINEYKNYFMLFTLIVILHMQRGLLEICLNSYFLQKYSQSISFLFILIKGIGYGVAIFSGMDLWQVLIIDLLAYTFIFIALQIVYIRNLPRSEGNLKMVSGTERARLFRYAFFYNFNDVGVGFLKPDFDYFIIATLLSPLEVGAYAFCQKIPKLLGKLLPVKYFIDVIRPAFFSISQNKDKNRSSDFFQFLIKINYLFNIPIFFFIALLGNELIQIIFGGKFLEYSYVLTAVAFFSLLSTFIEPVMLVAQLKEKANIILYSKVFSVYNLLADIVLIKYFGLWGAVIATGTAILGKNIFIWFFVRKEANLKGMGKFFLICIVFWCLVAGIVIQIINVFSNSLVIFIIGIIFMTIFFILQFRFHFFNDKEINMFRTISEKDRRIKFIINFLGIVSK